MTSSELVNENEPGTRYNEFVIVTEAPQCNRMTATEQDTDDKIIIYK